MNRIRHSNGFCLYLYQTDREFILFSQGAKLCSLRHNIRLDQLQQGTLMQSFRGPCLAALEKGKAGGFIPAGESSGDLFHAIRDSIRGCVVIIVIYGRLYGEDRPWGSRYRIVEKGILCAPSAGWNLPEG